MAAELVEVKQPLVGVIMGSESDMERMQAAGDVLDKYYQIPWEYGVRSAHRTPRKMFEYADRAADRGLQIIIAGAGGSAHLPGMVAAITELPVIGVPIKTGFLDGLDSLLSIVQMPRGIPVATVAIGGSENAAHLAARIIARTDSNVARKVREFMIKQGDSSMQSDEEIHRVGILAYLNNKTEGH